MTVAYSRLGEVAEFINGAAFKPTDWGEVGNKIIRIQNLTDRSKPYNRTTRKINDQLYVQPGDLLVSWSATLGVFEWNDLEVGVLNQHIFRVLPKAHKIDKRYLRHALELALLDMRQHMHGATMLHVNRGEFLSTKLYLPPLPEQRRIAAILDKAEALRAKRREALAQLDSLTQSIFFEMFGDPATNPKGWLTTSLEQISSKITDGEHQTPRRSDSGIKLLSARNVRDGYLDFSDVDYVDEAEYKRIAKRCNPQRGDILISCSGSIGRVATVETDEPLAMVRSAALVKPDATKVTHIFLEAYLRTPFLNRLMIKSAHSSSQANLFQGPIRALPVFVPPLELQALFASKVSALGCIRNFNILARNSMDDLFFSLQHRAFRGKL